MKQFFCEDRAIKYIELHDCTSREWEICNHKRENAIEFQSDGALRMSKKDQKVHQEPTGEHRIRMAMLRRGLAMQLVGSASYTVVEQATTKLFSFLSREPIKGYKAVSLQQVVMAEKQMWVEVAHATVGQVLDTGSPKPVDTALLKALDSPEVKQFLLFLPLPSENAHPKPGTKREGTKPPPTASAPAKRQKGKSKGKGKGPSIPPGCVATLPTGERVCFGFNRCTCARQKDPACDRGKHVCWRSGCHGAHPGAECPNS